jgi:hypothetical protein
MNGNGYERTERLVGASIVVGGVVGAAWLVAMVYVIATWSISG